MCGTRRWHLALYALQRYCGNASWGILQRSTHPPQVVDGDKLNILAVLPSGAEPAADNPHYLGCAEKALSLANCAKEHGATLVATEDKDREGSGESSLATLPIVA